MSIDVESLRIFVKVAELESFTEAGKQLGLSKSRVSLRVTALEQELGSRLLQRSTRVVRLTPDGEQLLPRARKLVVDTDEVGTMFQAPSSLKGRVRVDLPVNFARDVLIPRLPELLAAHPQLEVLLSVTDRRVELLKEGFDCVLRVGALADSGLVARKLGVLPMMNVASPAYLRKHGVPLTLDDLDDHLVVHYSLSLGADEPTFEHPDGHGRWVERPVRSVVTVNNADAYLAACIAGLGIIQVPRVGLTASLTAGAIVEVLPEHGCQPMPVTLVHGHSRNPPRRVRAVMTWIEQVLTPHLG